MKEVVLKNFANFTGKHLCWKRLRACYFITKILRHKCFPVKFVKFLKTTILKNICVRLPLTFHLQPLLGAGAPNVSASSEIKMNSFIINLFSPLLFQVSLFKLILLYSNTRFCSIFESLEIWNEQCNLKNNRWLIGF